MDKSSIRTRLMPSQLAVGVSYGGVIMVYATRHWLKHRRANNQWVLLQKDIRNAFNELLPHEFLRDAQQHAPASARFAAYCYGGLPTWFTRERLKHAAGGSKDVPL